MVSFSLEPWGGWSIKTKNDYKKKINENGFYEIGIIEE